MDELTAYVLNNYMKLMTLQEYRAWTRLVLEEKKTPVAQIAIERLTSQWGKDGAIIGMLLEQGHEKFLTTVRDRILRDCSDQIVLNRCPKCSGLTRTPRAKQCLSCGLDWH